MKNNEKQLKKLGFSRFFEVLRVTKSMNNQLGGQVRTNYEAKLACWRAKWSEEGQVEATWRLRGAKLDLKGALEAPQEAPKWPKRATRDFDLVATGARRVYFLGPGTP